MSNYFSGVDIKVTTVHPYFEWFEWLILALTMHLPHYFDVFGSVGVNFLHVFMQNYNWLLTDAVTVSMNSKSMNNDKLAMWG